MQERKSHKIISQKILNLLRLGHHCRQKNVESIATEREGMQLSFFQLEDPVLLQIRDEIAGLDINSLTPLEALNKLSEIKKIAGI